MHRILLITYDLIRVLMWALVAAFAVFSIYVFIQEPGLLQHANAMVEEEIVREDLDFCNKYGPPSNTHRNVLCTIELRKIRDEDRYRFSSTWPW